MKYTLFALFLILSLALTGCGSPGKTLNRHLDRAEENIESAVKDALYDSVPAGAPTAPADEITPREAESIALNHAGFTADQVTYLRTEYEIDDGYPQYEVTFHRERWEYDYEIDARTGNILSFERDD